MEWVKPGASLSNEILECDGFYVSYNGGNINASGLPETALVIPMPGTFKLTETSPEIPNKCFAILEGDFRKQYEDVFPDLEKCKDVFRKYRGSHEGFWSNGLPEDKEDTNG